MQWIPLFMQMVKERSLQEKRHIALMHLSLGMEVHLSIVMLVTNVHTVLIQVFIAQNVVVENPVLTPHEVQQRNIILNHMEQFENIFAHFTNEYIVITLDILIQMMLKKICILCIMSHPILTMMQMQHLQQIQKDDVKVNVLIA